jgi:hypothetical protein
LQAKHATAAGTHDPRRDTLDARLVENRMTVTMLVPPPRSLKHEYELFVEEEIENYKDTIPRTDILRIGDEAAAILRAQEQFTMDELLLWAEVDKIIRKRLRIPAFATWRRRRLRLLEEYRRPENLGLRPDGFLAKEIKLPAEARVLVAGSDVQKAALYLAAHGCKVTALDEQPAAVERVMAEAHKAGLTSRLHAHLSALASWAPENELSAVVCSPAAFEGLTIEQRERAISVLQSATRDGGIHLVETIIAGDNALTLAELRRSYKGWRVSVEDDVGTSKTFLAQKMAS